MTIDHPIRGVRTDPRGRAMTRFATALVLLLVAAGGRRDLRRALLDLPDLALAVLRLGVRHRDAIRRRDWLAMARSVDVPLTMDDFQAVSDRTPLLADLKPSGTYVMEDLHAVGGTPAVSRSRLRAGRSLSLIRNSRDFTSANWESAISTLR